MKGSFYNPAYPVQLIDVNGEEMIVKHILYVNNKARAFKFLYSFDRDNLEENAAIVTFFRRKLPFQGIKISSEIVEIFSTELSATFSFKLKINVLKNEIASLKQDIVQEVNPAFPSYAHFLTFADDRLFLLYWKYRDQLLGARHILKLKQWNLLNNTSK